MKKSIICLAVNLMIFVFSPAHAFTLSVENDTDRLGCDYRDFPVPGPGVAYIVSAYVCMNECGIDPICQAWNYDPTTGTPEGHRCFLKTCANEPTPSPGKVSGAKFPFNMSTYEYNVDRVGKDYKNFTAGSEVACSNACGLDPICQAWNWDSRSGIPGMCWLKSSVPPHKAPIGSLAA